ncbi:MAG: PQQ-dependent sugar dehydrogenase [Crocinitomicaceae bacterium]|nr:PQQ-dependent sugar dehydrogenase [Crocinitomicaceae bacterium]
MKKLFSILLTATGLCCNDRTIAQPTWQVGNTTLTETNLVTGIVLPWEILWGPDDYIWCTTRPGKVLRIDPESGNYTIVLDKSSIIPNNGSGEPGMLGMAIHPEWNSTPLVFIVYNYTMGNSIRERLSCFEWNGTSLVNEVQLINDIPGNYIHNGSRLLITPDHKLMMTTGDTGDGGISSQNIASLNGKVLRINLDGSVPSDNPNPDSYVWSLGHRNGQGLCLGPNGLIYESEHGQNNSDELNIIAPSRNYGWPEVEGACNTSSEQSYCTANNVKEPIREWSPCRAVNGIEYYNHPAIPEWNNSVLMAVLGGLSSDYERMTVLHLSGDGLSITGEDSYFSQFNQRIRDICLNPYTGAVYVAFNGVQYPGSGPNLIKEFRNLNFNAINKPTRSSIQEISIFPNPAEDRTVIQFSESFYGSNFTIHSFSGKLMTEQKVDRDAVEIDCSRWGAGNYFLTATSSLGTITKTMMVK